jgi:hypothetical protein
MAIGPGKYDAACTAAREATGARGVILIVFGGKLGDGFSAQLELPVAALVKIPAVLRTVADSIEADTHEN